MKFNPIIILLALAALSQKSSSTPSNFKKKRVTSRYGPRTNPVTGKAEFHNGLDLALAANTPLTAPDDSTIVFAGKTAAGGNEVIYKIRSGFTIGYAHLNRLDVKTGQKVKKGQSLGLSGSTGNSTGPHIHITVRDPKGQLIDPGPYFKIK